MQAPSTFQLIMNISYLFAKIGSLIGVLFWLTACAQESNYNQLLQSNQIESEVPNEPDLGEQQENKPCVTPDGDIVASGEWAHGKWVAFQSEVGCSRQSAKCENGAWTSNTINPVNKDGSPLPSFELHLTPDQCTGVGRCGWSSDTYVVQTGITQATCENTYYTGGYHQAVRGTWYIHGGTDGSFGAMLNGRTKSNCGITTGTGYCWWDD